MADINRKTQEVVSLVSVEKELPQVGQLVLALGLGGKLTEVVWTKDSYKFFRAWMKYPRIPPEVKEELYNILIGEKTIEDEQMRQ